MQGSRLELVLWVPDNCELLPVVEGAMAALAAPRDKLHFEAPLPGDTFHSA